MSVALLWSDDIAHAICHDLEGFYWVLLWVVIRHVAHRHPLGNALCAKVFPNSDTVAAWGRKVEWFNMEFRHFSVPENAPLLDLIYQLAGLVQKARLRSVELDYDTFLAAFDQALAREDWPVNDAALPFKVPELRTNMMGWINPVPRPLAGSKRSTMEDHPDDQPQGDFDDESIASDASERRVEFMLLGEPIDDDDGGEPRSKRQKTDTSPSSQASASSDGTGSSAASSFSAVPSFPSSCTSVDLEHIIAVASQSDLHAWAGPASGTRFKAPAGISSVPAPPRTPVRGSRAGSGTLLNRRRRGGGSGTLRPESGVDRPPRTR